MSFDLQSFINGQIAARPVEATLIRKVYRALKAAGNPVVNVWDGEENNPIASERDLLEQAFNLDELTLYTQSGAFVFIVMGQGAEGLTDYNVSLEDALEPVSEWIDKNLD